MNNAPSKQPSLYKKYAEVISYIFFGALTTAVNILVYFFFDSILHLGTLPSNLIAWAASVIFAYVTNKLWVFNNKSWKKSVWIPECLKFISARIFTGALDQGIMWLTVDLLEMPSLPWKIITNIIVIIINYITSKLLVFIKKP